jgi:hypothetical protein
MAAPFRYCPDGATASQLLFLHKPCPERNLASMKYTNFHGQSID